MDVHEVTQGIERDIIETLKEMIEAAQKGTPGDAAVPGPANQANRRSLRSEVARIDPGA